MLNNTFFKFLFGFVVIIAVAFGVLALANSGLTTGVDTLAHPR